VALQGGRPLTGTTSIQHNGPELIAERKEVPIEENEFRWRVALSVIAEKEIAMDLLAATGASWTAIVKQTEQQSYLKFDGDSVHVFTIESTCSKWASLEAHTNDVLRQADAIRNPIREAVNSGAIASLNIRIDRNALFDSARLSYDQIQRASEIGVTVCWNSIGR
jgi:hypothetical protein